MSDHDTAAAIPLGVVEICIKNTALHLRRVFQDAQNRARKTPENSTKITPSDKIRPKPAPPYAIGCRFASSLGHDFTQTISQEQYEEKWMAYVGEGIRLKSESQEHYEECAAALATLMKGWNALDEDTNLETWRNSWETIDSVLQYDASINGNEQPAYPSNRVSNSSTVLVRIPTVQTPFDPTPIEYYYDHKSRDPARPYSDRYPFIRKS